MLDALDDPRRVWPSSVASEAETLQAWLDFHRTTLLLKCEGLTDTERKRRPIESSLLSLHGLVRHLTDVERCWFQWNLRGLTAADLPPHYWRSEESTHDFAPLDDAVWEHDLQTWQDECAASRDAVRGLEVDHTVQTPDGDLSLRWILAHMVEEYARHNGHADLIREMLDGAVGD